ncbi:unnamed protein product [Adineta steineri]|uniref:Uncharacterized protein n=1 Tax=Adineta steineri TaxID=433720 RepID=A0A814HLZ3_9BILA|nr:unnamed protein product [Adineta steineri]CAF3922907.1 unnamed protein product [Adineta steineri]
MENDKTNLNNAVFSGFVGGYDSVPGVGNVPPAGIPLPNIDANGNYRIGANLPHVDPSHFPGIVHWGPEQILSSSQVEIIPIVQSVKDQTGSR